MKLFFVLSVLFVTTYNYSKAQIIGDSTDIVWQVKSPAEIRSIQFSPDSKLILTGHGDDYNSRIWDVKDGALIHEIINQEQPVFSHDGQFIATRKLDSISIWKVGTWELVKSIKTNCQLLFQVQFSPDDRYIAAAQHLCGLSIWDVQTGKLFKNISNFPIVRDPKGNYNHSAENFNYSPDGNFIAFNGGDTYIYDLNKDTVIATYSNIRPKYSPDGKFLLTQIYGNSNKNQGLNYLNLTTGQLVWTKDMGQYNFSFCFSPDGKYLLTASDGNLGTKIWDINNPSKPYSYGPWSTVQHVSASDDYKYVAVGVGQLLVLYSAKYNLVSVKDNNISISIKSIYPNPTNSFIEISGINPMIEHWGDGSDVKIYNVFGQIQTTPSLRDTPPNTGGEKIKIDVSGLVPGMYFVRIGDKVEKFIKL